MQGTLDHADIASTLRYLHSDLDDVRAGLDKLAGGETMDGRAKLEAKAKRTLIAAPEVDRDCDRRCDRRLSLIQQGAKARVLQVVEYAPPSAPQDLVGDEPFQTPACRRSRISLVEKLFARECPEARPLALCERAENSMDIFSGYDAASKVIRSE